MYVCIVVVIGLYHPAYLVYVSRVVSQFSVSVIIVDYRCLGDAHERSSYRV